MFQATSIASVLQSSPSISSTFFHFHIVSTTLTLCVFALIDSRIAIYFKKKLVQLEASPNFFKQIIRFFIHALQAKYIRFWYPIAQLILIGFEIASLPQIVAFTLVFIPFAISGLVSVGALLAIYLAFKELEVEKEFTVKIPSRQGSQIFEKEELLSIKNFTDEFSQAVNKYMENDKDVPTNSIYFQADLSSTNTSDYDEDKPNLRDHLIGSEEISEPNILTKGYNWMMEVNENRDTEVYGQRIKWRRLSYLVGGIGLLVYAIYNLITVFTSDELKSFDNFVNQNFPEIKIDPDSEAGEKFLKIYRTNQEIRSPILLAAALVYIGGIACDIFGMTKKWLNYSRLCTIVGSFLVFVYVVLSYGLDYSEALTFPALKDCTGSFCDSLKKNAKQSLGAVQMSISLLGLTPIYINIPWTLARVAFFLKDHKSISTCLQWGSYLALTRLLVLPVTVAFLFLPQNHRLLPLYILLVTGSVVGGLCFAIPYQGRFKLKSLRKVSLTVWYAVWSYLIYVVLWALFIFMGLGSNPRQVWEMIRGMFEGWELGATLAEFFLSDVLISDILFWLFFP